jgi:hypothetical protein
MSSILEVLPTELFLNVIRFLRHADLTLLARSSRQLQAVVEPILWTKIEFHSQSFHEYHVHKQLKEEEEALQRPYHQYISQFSGKDQILGYGGNQRDEQYHHKVRSFFKVLQNDHKGDQKRVDDLAGRVRWLCLPVNGMSANWHKESDPWNALAVLKNLEYLELSAFWKPLEEVVPFAGSSHTLLNLSTLKLRGYIPADFVDYLLRSASTITNLELGLLDVPLGNVEQQYPPPPLSPMPTESDDNENMADADAADEVEKSPSPSLAQPQDVENVEEADESSVMYNDIAPRSMVCLVPNTISYFTSLNRVYLCRPSEAGDQSNFMTMFTGVFTSVRADIQILKEWAALIRGVRNTIVHLTLDQRPVGEENEPDGTTNREFMFLYNHGPGYHRFVEHVVPVFLEDVEWPALKSIQLFGFEWDGRKLKDSWHFTRSGEGVDIDKQLQQRFPKVAVSSALGKRMLFTNDTGEVASGGDVLDTSNSFSDDEH